MCARCLKEGGLFNPASKPLKKKKAALIIVQESSRPLRLLPLGVLLLSLALGFMPPSKAMEVP